jgi:hypothetical protein
MNCVDYYQNEVVHMLLDLADANYFKDSPEHARQKILTDIRTETWAYIPEYVIEAVAIQNTEKVDELNKAGDNDFFHIAYDVLSELKYEKNTLEGRRKRVLEFVIAESPFIYRLKLDQLLEETNRSNEKHIFQTNDFILIKGAVQSGKSALIRGIASVLLSYGITPVLILRDFKGDYFQMKDGIMSFNKKYEECFGTDDKLGTIPILYAGDKKMKEMSKALKGTTPKMIACLCNHSQISIVNSILNDQSMNVAVIVDEIDSVNYVNEPLSKTGQELRELFENCGTKFGITATVFNVVCNEDSLLSEKVFVMGEQSVYGTYKGVLNIIFKELPSPSSSPIKGPSHRSDNQFEMDPNIIPFYKYLGGEGMFRQDMYNMDDDHPVIVLHKTTNLVCQHMNLLTEFMRNDHLKWNWTAIVYNGNGITLYSPLLSEPILDVERSMDGFYEFNDVSLQDILQYLKDNGGARRFSYICVVSGILAGRGINFVSRDKQWHLTHQYYIPSSTAKCADLLQGMRLCGVYRDPIPLTCHVPYKVKKDIIKSYYLQEDIVSRLSNRGVNELVVDTLKKEVFHKEKFPKGRSYTSGGEKSRVRLTKTRDDEDGGMDLTLFDVKQLLEDEDDDDNEKAKDTAKDNESCKPILKIVPSKLTSTMYTLYEDVVEYLIQVEKEQTWIRRANILNFFQSEGKIYSSIASSLTKMAKQGKKVSEEYVKRNIKSQESGSRLFFKKVEDEWYVLAC